MPSIIIPGYRQPNKITFRKKSEKIVQHYQHAYDEHGEVIVVEGDKDNIELMVNQYKDQVGLKNVLKAILKTGDPKLVGEMAYNDETESHDVSGIPGHGINELGDYIAANSGEAFANLALLNEKLGTNFTPETLLQAVVDGSLQTLINEKINTPEPTPGTEGDAE